MVTQSGNGYVGTAGGETVFTLTINANTGAYNFTLLGALDHANPADHNDAMWLKFGFDAKDTDGDIGSGTLTIDVRDDGPAGVASVARAVDEAGIETNGSVTLTNTLNIDYGQDGEGSVQPTGTVMNFFQMGGANQPITSGGDLVTITSTANGYVGKTAGGTTISRSTKHLLINIWVRFIKA